jgi:hypothetical protein
MPIRPFNIRASRGIFLHPSIWDSGRNSEPAVELLVSENDRKMLFSHGDVKLMYSNCKDGRDDTQIGYKWPYNVQNEREVSPGKYVVGFTLDSMMTARKDLLGDPKNIRCIYVDIPREYGRAPHRSNAIVLPAPEYVVKR